MNVNKDFLASKVSSVAGTKKGLTRIVIDALFEEIQHCVADGDRVVISGFGSFTPIVTKERVGTDINNGNRKIIIPAKKKVKFNIGEKFKKEIEEKE